MSAVMIWLGMTSFRTPNQKREILVRSLPLSGMPFFKMTSKADILSEATKRRESDLEDLYMSLTFPVDKRVRSGRFEVIRAMPLSWSAGVGAETSAQSVKLDQK